MRLEKILVLLIFTLLTGCDSLYFPISFENEPGEELQIEVLRPADMTMTQSVKTLLVFSKPGLHPKIMAIEEKESPILNFKFDMLAGKEFQSMADLLSESPRFSIFEPVAPLKPSTGNSYSLNELDTLCINAGTDCCLILDQQDVLFGLVSVGGMLNYSSISLVSSYQLYFHAEKILLTKQIKTQMDNIDDINEELNEHGLDSLVSDFARQNGEKFVYCIAPLWQINTRNYYLTGNREMESVNELIKAEKWGEVYAIWRRNKDNRNAITAMHASYNSILSYELEGKLDSAMIMARLAYKRFGTEEIVDYGLILEERMRENELVNIQMGAK